MSFALPILRVLFLAVLAFALFMAWTPHPPNIGAASDKLNHMGAFVTLTVLACAAFPRMPLVRVGEHLLFLGALIEVVQAIPALHRDCDILDWVADTVAVVGVLVVVAVARRGHERRPSPDRR